MPVTSLHLQGCTRVERHAMVDIVEESIREVNGWILDFHQYSNISLVLEMEVPPGRLERLLDLLRAGGVSFGALPELHPEDQEDAVLGTLQITFIHNEGDLHVATPPLATPRSEQHPHPRH